MRPVQRVIDQEIVFLASIRVIRYLFASEEQNAAQRALGTFEILEKILWSMPKYRSLRTMRTILFAQRVNSTFYNVIQQSKRLQQLLFFEPISQDSAQQALIAKKEKHGTYLIDWNTLLLVLAPRPMARNKRKRRRQVRQRAHAFDDCLKLHNVILRVPYRSDESLQHSWRRMLLAHHVFDQWIWISGKSLGDASSMFTLDLQFKYGDKLCDIIRCLEGAEDHYRLWEKGEKRWYIGSAADPDDFGLDVVESDKYKMSQFTDSITLHST